MREKNLKVKLEVSVPTDCVPTIGNIYYFDMYRDELLLCAYHENGCVLVNIKNPINTYVHTEEDLLYNLKSGTIKKVPDGTKIIITT